MMVMVFLGEEFLPEWKDSFDDEGSFKDWYKYNMHYYPEILIARRFFGDKLYFYKWAIEIR